MKIYKVIYSLDDEDVLVRYFTTLEIAVNAFEKMLCELYNNEELNLMENYEVWVSPLGDVFTREYHNKNEKECIFVGIQEENLEETIPDKFFEF